MAKKIQIHYLKLEIKSTEDALIQCKQWLDEEVKEGFIRSYKIENEQIADKDSYCIHSRKDSQSEFCPDCECLLTAES